MFSKNIYFLWLILIATVHQLLAQEKVSIQTKIDNFTYINNLHTIGIKSQNNGQYLKAKKELLECLQLCEKEIGTKNDYYAMILGDIGLLYEQLEEYGKAEKYLIQAIDIQKETLKDTALKSNLSIVPKLLNDLGLIYLGIGEYGKAEALFIEAFKIEKDLITLSNLIATYRFLGKLEKAHELSYELYESTTESDTMAYSYALNNLAITYMDIEEYEEAERFFLELIEFQKKRKISNQVENIPVFSNLAKLYETTGRYNKRDSIYLEIIDICKKTHKNNLVCANSLLEITNQNRNSKQNKALKSNYEKTLKIQNRKLSKKHPDYLNTLTSFSAYFRDEREYLKADKIYRQLQKGYLYHVEKNFCYLSEGEKQKYLKSKEEHFQCIKGFYSFDYLKNKKNARDFYDLELAIKSIILKAQIKMRESIANSGDSTVLAIFEEWQDNKRLLAKQYSLPITDRMTKLDSIEEYANLLEKDLIRKSVFFRKQKATFQIKWQDVQAKLQKDEVAIEFSAFPYFNGKEWTDSTQYVALVLRKGTKQPVLVPLFEEKSLDSLLHNRQTQDENVTNELYGNTEKGQKLYDLLWKPLEKALGGAKKVYFSPSGKLHQIAFAALPYGKGLVLSDRYKLVQVNSTAALAEEKEPLELPKTIALFGGIDYNASDAQRSAIVKELAATNVLLAENRALPSDLERGSTWNYLPGSKVEVEAIERIAKEQQLTSNVFSRHAALEENFKRLAGKQSADIIHIATHGFFFPDPKKDLNKQNFGFIGDEKQTVFRLSDNPLHRSGLLFAGANLAWSGKENNGNLEDGILTAYEAANVYLPHTQLVVLSACETALGEIKGSEGVFGLQRAFQLSGARNLIMSLWKIPDAEAAEFMKVFYQHYLGGKTVSEAFRLTQLFMRTKYKNEPYKWAAFVLIEN